jgi:hypothetical protein
MKPPALLARGMLAGLAAAVLATVFAAVFGEPQVARAIAIEAAHAPSGAGEAELVSRTVQSTVGLAVAVAVYGAAIGGIFGLAFALVHGRFGRTGVRGTAAVVAGAGFVIVGLVPFLKYPANPPAVGQPETLGRRTALYAVLLLVGVLAAVLAAILKRHLDGRFGPWEAALVAAGVFVAVVGLAAALLPSVDEVPADFPATTLWRFRIATLGTQAVLWTGLGLTFGVLVERLTRRGAEAR